MFRFIIRIIGIFLCIYGHNNVSYPPESIKHHNVSLMCRCQYLTIIGLYLTLVTLSLLVLNQIAELFIRREMKTMRTAIKFLVSIVLPIETVVTLTFWVLYLYDPKVILNEILIKTNSIRMSHNLCLHLIPILLLVIEAMFLNLKRQNLHVIVLCFFSLAYYVFLRNVALTEKRWPYPFLDDRSEIGRIGIFFALTLAGVLFYEIAMLALTKRMEKDAVKQE